MGRSKMSILHKFIGFFKPLVTYIIVPLLQITGAVGKSTTAKCFTKSIADIQQWKWQKQADKSEYEIKEVWNTHCL